MMPRDINDQPGDVPGEGGEKVPRAVRYLLDGYPGHVRVWHDDDPPAVLVTPEAWEAIVNTAAECGELQGFRIVHMGTAVVTARLRVGDDSDEVSLISSLSSDGPGPRALKVNL